VNAPVVEDGRCLGVLNFSALRERMGESAAAAAAALASVMAPAFRR
jgi:CBS domain-containing protein